MSDEEEGQQDGKKVKLVHGIDWRDPDFRILFGDITITPGELIVMYLISGGPVSEMLGYLVAESLRVHRRLKLQSNGFGQVIWKQGRERATHSTRNLERMITARRGEDTWIHARRN